MYAQLDKLEDADAAEREGSEAVAGEPGRTAAAAAAAEQHERALRMRNLHLTMSSIYAQMTSDTSRLAALENELRTVPPLPPPAAAPVVRSLEELILLMGGQTDEQGVLQLRMLHARRHGSLSTEFRGRTSELRQFAADVEHGACSRRAEDHPFFVATALPGTGKTTFGFESFDRLPDLLSGSAADIVRNGVVIYLNLNGGQYCALRTLR